MILEGEEGACVIAGEVYELEELDFGESREGEDGGACDTAQYSLYLASGRMQQLQDLSWSQVGDLLAFHQFFIGNHFSCLDADRKLLGLSGNIAHCHFPVFQLEQCTHSSCSFGCVDGGEGVFELCGEVVGK